MSIRRVDASDKHYVAQKFRYDVASVLSTAAVPEFESLTETERSAATIGVAPDALKPISWLNQGHYGELLKSNSLSGRLTQQIESFKVVAGGN